MGVPLRNPKNQTKLKLFVPGIFAVAVYLWCCNSLGKADFNSEHQYRDEDGSQRPRSLKIQGLEMRIDAVVNEFKTSSHHCAELGVEILGAASELKEQVSAFHKAFAHFEGDHLDFDSLEKYSKCGSRPKGFISWVNTQFGPALQIIGLITTIFVVLKLFKAFQKSQLPRITEKWNTFLHKVSFDPSFDYMVDVYQDQRNR